AIDVPVFWNCTVRLRGFNVPRSGRGEVIWDRLTKGWSMSVRVAGPARALVENLEERRLLSGAGDAVAWDLKTPASGEISQTGEVDYFRFTASAGEKIVFDSSGMKQFTILDSDGAAELDHLFIYDYQ